MSDLQELSDLVVGFRDERDWAQFHNQKDVALSLSLEVAELLEHMQWVNGSDLVKRLSERKEAVGEELADVLYYTLLLARDLDIDLETAFRRKMAINAEKYPASKSRGSNKKYTEI